MTAEPRAVPGPRRTPSGPAGLPAARSTDCFDEAFLRRLEQLDLASRRPCAGGLKGGRRSVQRGQSVEFADYRNYTPATTCGSWTGTSTRAWSGCSSSSSSKRRTSPSTSSSTPAAPWTSGSRTSSSSPSGRRRALGYIGLATGTGSASPPWAGRAARRQLGRSAAPAASSGSCPTLSAIEPAVGPTDLVAASRHAAAQLPAGGRSSSCPTCSTRLPIG